MDLTVLAVPDCPNVMLLKERLAQVLEGRREVTVSRNDPAWSNEGLFAFLQGIRRLHQIGGERVALPSIELEF